MIPIKHAIRDVPRIGTLGSLLGTTGTAATQAYIANQMGSTFLGTAADPHAHLHNEFVKTYIEPLRRTAELAFNTVASMVTHDTIRPLVTIEDFQNAPPAMYLPILYYEPVRQLHDLGRVQGYGFSPTHIEGEDVYGRLCNNGTVNDIAAAVQKNAITLSWTWDSEDPALDLDQVESIRDTRDEIDWLIYGGIDPTDPQSKIG